MAVIRMLNEKDETFPEGAYCDLGWSRSNYSKYMGQDADGKYIYKDTPMTERGGMVLVEEYKGLCLFESERNGYHDSDFYMTIWDPVAQRPFTIEFASTRGWCYPAMASKPDATPEVQAAYAAWKRAYERRQRILGKREHRNKILQRATVCGLTRAEWMKLAAAVGQSIERYEALLKVKNYRSEFRKKLATQVREWIATKDNKYRTPLSIKQDAYV